MDESVHSCTKNANMCSKPFGHAGAHDKKRKCSFQESSPVLEKQRLSAEINKLRIAESKLLNSHLQVSSELTSIKEVIVVAELNKKTLIDEVIEIDEKKNTLDCAFTKLNVEYDKFKFIIDQKKHSKSQREKNPSSEDTPRTTRYSRLSETKNMLEYIHGIDGAIFGAWDFLRKNASDETIEKFLVDYKKGKFIEKLNGKFNDSIQKSEEAMNEAVAAKHKLHLSRRKFLFMYKIKSKIYEPETEKWNRKSISYGDKTFNLRNMNISDRSVVNFVYESDIGIIHTIPGYCGVFRTIASLTTTIIDLHLKCNSLRRKLVWYNDIPNHFIFEFSDDGAPESKKESMCIGSLTCWNFGKRVRSRNFHYPIHMITAKEKDDVVANHWNNILKRCKFLKGIL